MRKNSFCQKLEKLEREERAFTKLSYVKEIDILEEKIRNGDGK